MERPIHGSGTLCHLHQKTCGGLRLTRLCLLAKDSRRDVARLGSLLKTRHSTGCRATKSGSHRESAQDMPKHAYIDEASFAGSEKACGSKRANGVKIKFSTDATTVAAPVATYITPSRLKKLEQVAGIPLSEQAGLELDEAIREFKKTFDHSEAWRSEAVDATKRFAKYGSLNALKKLIGFWPAFVLVVYETLLYSGAQHIDAEARAAEIEAVIDPLPKEAALPLVARDLVIGAQRRVADLLLDEIKRRDRRPANSHVDLLVVRVAGLFEGAAGTAHLGRGEPFVRFLRELHKYLPKPMSPATPRAFVRHAKNGLQTFRKKTEVWRLHCGVGK